MIKKGVAVTVILTILLVSMVSSAALALPTNEAKAKAAVGYWTIDSPKAGGWVFASVMQSQAPTIGNKIFVSGYHPPGAAGPNAKVFSGWGICDEFEWFMDHVTAKATIDLDVVTINAATGARTTSSAKHTVEITWVTINPTSSIQVKETINGIALDITGMGRNSDATITITKSSTADHNTWTTSGAFVIHADKFSMILP